jgi:membrane-associated phospholipid phosphatase
LLLGIGFYRWRRERRLENILCVVSWTVLFSVLYIPPMYVAGRCSGDFCDALLARIDRALGLEVPQVLRFMEGHATLKRVLDVSYDVLLPFMTIAIILPPLCGHMERAKEYLVAGVISAALGLSLFALMPAVGPWTQYAYPLRPDQERCAEILTSLRTQHEPTLVFSNTDGIVALPSFHTILALLAAFALWKIPYVRWPAALLALAIIVSTMTTGWHYLVDVIAGILLALIACAGAKGYTWLERRACSTSRV